METNRVVAWFKQLSKGEKVAFSLMGFVLLSVIISAISNITIVKSLDIAATAGKFSYEFNSMETADSVGGKTTDNQFVVIKVTITNNDDSARDISKGQFVLTDDAGRKYAAVSVGSTNYLGNETLGPGISRTRYLAFETPKKVSGMSIIVDNGVLAGGDKVTVALK